MFFGFTRDANDVEVAIKWYMRRKYPRVSSKHWDNPVVRRKVTRYLYLSVTRLRRRRLHTEGDIVGVSITDRFSSDEEYKSDLKKFEGFVRTCDLNSDMAKLCDEFNAPQEQTVEQFQTAVYRYPEVWYA